MRRTNTKQRNLKKQNTKGKKKRFPIVGIGASAGGLESFVQLLNQLPNNTGLALVFVQHLDPNHASLSTDIFGRATSMPVAEIRDGDRVEPNHVYALPPNYGLTIQKGLLRLQPRGDSHLRKPIDTFFKSLAEDQRELAIGVVLSGTASDGTEGLRAIKNEGGFTFAQSPKSAKFDGMPRAAIESGVVDSILTPLGIANELARIAVFPYVAPIRQTAPTALMAKQPSTADEPIDEILSILRLQTNADFSGYKKSTLNRRIQRRMAVLKLAAKSAYAKYLREHAEESNALFSEILIHVTHFFRDPKAFSVLQKKVFPKIVKDHDQNTPIRVWVPGCSSGEEAYSIAISLLEYLKEIDSSLSVQVFASDISETEIQKARRGFYSDAGVKNVSPSILKRFFTKGTAGYSVNKDVRNLCIFSKHDMVSDPPFAKVDLVSCRNLLIYFDSTFQKRAIPLLHYALSPGGFLFLGHSETIGGFSNLFQPVDKIHKIYQKKLTAGLPRVHFVNANYASYREGVKAKGLRLQPGSFDTQKEADRIVALKYGPSGVVINNDLEVLQFRGRTVPYLEQPSGNASYRLLKMAHPGLAPALRLMVQSAKTEESSVRKDGIQIEYDGETKEVSIEVVPLNITVPANDRQYLILFETPTTARRGLSANRNRQDDARAKVNNKPLARDQAGRRIKQLEKQLSSTQENQQALVEDHEITQEEANAANEELQSANEELQSTNEELETAKEELQSTNEELTTVNDELQNRNEELNTLNVKLVHAEEISRLWVEGIKDYAIFNLDREGNVASWSDGARKLSGYEASEIIGKHFSVFYLEGEKKSPKADLELEEAIKVGRAEDTGWRVRKDGSKFWANIIVYPVVDKGIVLGFSKIVRDLTDRKNIEDERNLFLKRAEDALLEAERANRAKDIFLATLSHELRTPLSSILTWAQLIRLGKVDFEQAKSGALVIEDSAKVQSQLIEDLLDVSRIIAGKLSLKVKRIDAREVIQSAVESVRTMSDKKTIEIETTLSPESGVILADPMRLQQIIWNLLTNAVKFSNTRGKIEVRLSYTGDEAKRCVQIKVIDHGKGIPVEFLPNIFNTFSQADSTSTRRHGGLGLGLSIVHSLVEMQGGTVCAENAAKGKGAVFTLTFPLISHNVEVSQDVAPEKQQWSNGKGKKQLSLEGLRVLFVDDDEPTRESMTTILKSFGAEVIATESVSGALKVLPHFRPHIVLTDIAMPDEDGYTLLKKIRCLSRKDGRDVPAVALTAYASDGDSKRALAAGFLAHIAKPVDGTELAKAIYKFADRG